MKAAEPDCIDLVQLTDTHLFGDPRRILRGVAPFAALRDTLAASRARIEGCDAILATGDLVQDDAAGYAHFRELFGALGKPVLCIPGNHDDVPALRAALAGPPFHLAPTWDRGAWRIVLLDSSVPHEVGGRLGKDGLAALEQALEGAAGRHVLVALHHHPLPLGSAWLDDIGLADAGAFLAVLERHSCVRGVVFGHVHQAFEGRHGRVRVLGTPSTFSQFLPHSGRFAIDTRPPGWRTLRLQPDGRILTQLHWLGGTDAAGAAGQA